MNMLIVNDQHTFYFIYLFLISRISIQVQIQLHPHNTDYWLQLI